MTKKQWVAKKLKKKPDWYTRGRPTGYKPEYAKDILSYFEKQIEQIYYETQRFQPSKEQVQRHYEVLGEKAPEVEILWGKKAEIPRIVKSILPTFERRRAKHRIPSSTFFDRRDRYADFSESLDTCKEIQEAMLIEMGLAWIFNANITTLMLKNNHGWKDKIDIDQKTVVVFSEEDLEA